MYYTIYDIHFVAPALETTGILSLECAINDRPAPKVTARHRFYIVEWFFPGS